MNDVFVSYKAEDRARLKPLVAALEAEGLSVWWDAHIGTGADWREEIQQHLDAARCVIVAWSQRSVGPEGQFVCDEAGRAKRAGSYVPIKIDEVDPPLGFGGIQALSFVGWKGKRSDPRFVALVDAIKARLTDEAPVVRRIAASEPAVGRRTVIAGGVGALAVAGIGGWASFKPGAAAASTRIAVMSFSNMSGDPAQAYFADGIAEELRGALSRIGMQVIGKASCDAVKDLDIPSAAAKLGVTDILTGSFRRSPETIRVGAQLVNGKDGVQKWAQNYDRAPGDTIKIQTDIAAQVAQSLSTTLGGGAVKAIAAGGTTNPAAHDFYLKAKAQSVFVGDKDRAQEALALLDAAIALDPRYADAHILRAVMLSEFAGGLDLSAEQSHADYVRAAESGRRAIELAPVLAAGYAVFGSILADQLHIKAALVQYRLAAALPEDERFLRSYSRFLSQLGRYSDAIALANKAITLDPLNDLTILSKAYIVFASGNFSQSLGIAQSVLTKSTKLLDARVLSE